jgi:hypothetical protein
MALVAYGKKLDPSIENAGVEWINFRSGTSDSSADASPTCGNSTDTSPEEKKRLTFEFNDLSKNTEEVCNGE